MRSEEKVEKSPRRAWAASPRGGTRQSQTIIPRRKQWLVYKEINLNIFILRLRVETHEVRVVSSDSSRREQFTNHATIYVPPSPLPTLLFGASSFSGLLLLHETFTKFQSLDHDSVRVSSFEWQHHAIDAACKFD